RFRISAKSSLWTTIRFRRFDCLERTMPVLGLSADDQIGLLINQFAEAFAHDAVHGLAETQVNVRRERHGYNQLDEAPPKAWWLRLAGQFQDLVILVLFAAAVLSSMRGDWVDAAVIL